jgi:hypothetical protein
MKYNFLHIFWSILFVALLLITQGCTETWEEHYHTDNSELPDISLFEYIDSNPNLGTFKQMLESTGYDSILDASQTYTVWAPNNAALDGIDLTDEEAVTNLVKNHITRGNYSTAANDELFVKMLNGKYSRLDGGELSFGNKKIVEANNRTKNGLVHVLEDYVPYMYNIWEFIENSEDLDSVSDYLVGLNEKIFIPELSTELGYDSVGNVLYDSTFLTFNRLLTNLGALDVEDSIYSIILPDNNAWNEAYGRINGYFNVPDVFGGETRKHDVTQWTLIQDIDYRGLLSNPGMYSSITSTNNNTFYSPAEIFNGSITQQFSNGLVNITSQMPFSDTASWFKPISIEAEVEYGRSSANSNVFLRFGQGDDFEISNDRYILVEPTSTSDLAKSNVAFDIPNTLSATYDIYCVFIPASLTNSTNLKPSKVSYTLTYLAMSSGRTRRKSFKSDDFVTNPDGLTKMLVSRWDFEFANIVSSNYPTVAVSLEVTNAATVDEENAGDFTRTMRIDRLILEPVIE